MMFWKKDTDVRVLCHQIIVSAKKLVVVKWDSLSGAN